MSDMVLAALRRKRAIAEGAGLTLDVADLDRRIAEREGSIPPSAPGVAAKDVEPVEEPAELEMTAAARRKANELGLTDEDFADQKASGVSGFTVGDVERIAASRDDSLDDEDDD